jgi:outer membrane protein TolC
MRITSWFLALVVMAGPAVFGVSLGTPTLGVWAAEPAIPHSLTLQQCIDLALKQNTEILKAQQAIRRTHGVIVEARAAKLVDQIAVLGFQRAVGATVKVAD